MNITRLKITNFRGVEACCHEIPPSGAIFSGQNASGKTSRLKAIYAALLGRGIEADAIRIGADKAEILVDFDHLSVRRAITPKGGTLTVRDHDGNVKARPQTFLHDLFGSALDPLEFFLGNAKARRAQILAALAIRKT